MGSDEEAMGWIYDEIKRAVGLPERMGGLPLDKLGATGFGLSECAEVSCPYAGIGLKGARNSYSRFREALAGRQQGFFSEKGAIIVAASDTKGTIHNPDGLDLKCLFETKDSTGSVINCKKGTAKKKLKRYSHLIAIS